MSHKPERVWDTIRTFPKRSLKPSVWGSPLVYLLSNEETFRRSWEVFLQQATSGALIFQKG